MEFIFDFLGKKNIISYHIILYHTMPHASLLLQCQIKRVNDAQQNQQRNNHIIIDM